MIILDYNKGYKYVIEEKKIISEHSGCLCFSSSVKDFELLYMYLSKYIEHSSSVYVGDYSDSNINITVLYILTLLQCTLFLNEKEYELSFAYAVPLNRDECLRKFVLNNLQLCLDSKQIVFLPSETLYLYNSIPQKGLFQILHDERRTIKKNTSVSVEETGFSDDFFNFWEEYDQVRFNEIQSQNFQDFFKYVYSLEQFHLFKYSIDNNIVAYNVCYYSEEQKIIYDVLFPWKKTTNVYRVGIFSIIKNLLRAFEMQWGYSICYGKFMYKNAILDKLRTDKSGGEMSRGK